MFYFFIYLWGQALMHYGDWSLWWNKYRILPAWTCHICLKSSKFFFFPRKFKANYISYVCLTTNIWSLQLDLSLVGRYKYYGMVLAAHSQGRDGVSIYCPSPTRFERGPLDNQIKCYFFFTTYFYIKKYSISPIFN